MGAKVYVLVTPAHNEQEFIENTIRSVMNQTLRPLKWVIVNDASTDRTMEVVQEFSRNHSFIQLVNVQRSDGRSFGGKVAAFNRGLREVAELPWAFIGNLDADISIGRDYYERILGEFENDAKLGVAGGMVHSLINNRFVSQDVADDSVAGAVQVFRRQCFNDIGGYVALPHGGIDSAAEIKARMTGWTVRTFPQYGVCEHRRTGCAIGNPVSGRVREGRLYHSIGYSFLFQLARCVHRVGHYPMIIGSLAEMTGYLLGAINREPLVLPPDVIRYLRMEQRQKLKALMSGRNGSTAEE